MSVLFQANIIDPITGSTGVQASNNCTSILLEDTSNYSTSTESGHLLANFSNYRTFTVQYYSGALYPLSSVATPTPTCTVPSSGTQTASFTNTSGDGWYTYLLMTIPTWSVGNNYIGNAHQVWNPTDGNIYTCITTNTSTTLNRPDLTPADWTLVPAAMINTSTIFQKYWAQGFFALTCNTAVCIPKLLSAALCQATGCNNMSFCNNPNFLNAAIAIMCYTSVQYANATNKIQFTSHTWDVLKQICGCAPTPTPL